MMMKMKSQTKNTGSGDEVPFFGKKAFSGPLEERCFECLTFRTFEMVRLFTSTACHSMHIDTEEQLMKYEYDLNCVNGIPQFGYTSTLNYGAHLTAAQIKAIFPKIWKDDAFCSKHHIEDWLARFYHKAAASDDANEVLFWTFRFCAMGFSENKLPFTLYRCIVDGRLTSFFNRYPDLDRFFAQTALYV